MQQAELLSNNAPGYFLRGLTFVNVVYGPFPRWVCEIYPMNMLTFLSEDLYYSGDIKNNESNKVKPCRKML